MRLTLIVMLLLTVGLAPCRAQDIPAGTVTSASSALEGTYNVSFPTVAGIQIRDVFDVVRAGKPVGQAMALSIDPATNTVSISGLASFQGTPSTAPRARAETRSSSPGRPRRAPRSGRPRRDNVVMGNGSG